MKLKNGTIFTSVEPLKKLSNLDLPIKVGYNLGKRIKRISSQYDVIEAERNKLVKKYAAPDSNNVAPEKLQDFLKDFNAVLDIEEELDIAKIPLADLTGNGQKCDASTLLALDWLIEE